MILICTIEQSKSGEFGGKNNFAFGFVYVVDGLKVKLMAC